MGPTSYTQRPCREPLFDVHPPTGPMIEVFYADRALETFGRCGAGWFWWARRRGRSPAGPATGPFATSYSAYAAPRHRPSLNKVLKGGCSESGIAAERSRSKEFLLHVLPYCFRPLFAWKQMPN